jgi:hypothetical protein
MVFGSVIKEEHIMMATHGQNFLLRVRTGKTKEEEGAGVP